MNNQQWVFLIVDLILADAVLVGVVMQHLSQCRQNGGYYKKIENLGPKECIIETIDCKKRKKNNLFLEALNRYVSASEMFGKLANNCH